MAPVRRPAGETIDTKSIALGLLLPGRALRKRQVISSFRANPGEANHPKGAYWGIRTDIADYGLESALDCPHDRTMALAATPTRRSAWTMASRSG